MAFDGGADEFGDEVGWEFDGVGELGDGVEALDVDEFEEEQEEVSGVDAGVSEGSGLFGCAMVVWVRAFGFDVGRRG